ncbi:19715_t:CDS:2 [Funneliformis geosporum]|uniref:13821_t:CDS:1 n=1 Tax=Funneliformis geosporum TaxID=1117311 RepID=A0A9W4WPF2_9GLOM|nr:13821_t:CDS:2 [Funneliformis geosporum]CAI2162943.1 19715_t:CDS:2 [Funneliformis geosporum]
MYLPKYDGNIHPDEWINDIQSGLQRNNLKVDVTYAKQLVDPIINLPDETDENDSFERLRDALKDDISFTIVMDESILIRNGSIVALKHVATGKYLSSIKNLKYQTGSMFQLVFVNDLLNSDALWNITFTSGTELASYSDTYIYLQHKSSSNFLGMYPGYYKSPVTRHNEVCCSSQENWKFNHSKLENYQGYLKSNDIINLSFTNRYNVQQVFLRSHDFQFTIGNDSYQEVVCHNERLGGNDEWCIEIVKQNLNS